MHESVVRVRNQIEVLLEQAQMKLSSVVTDILGKSGRRCWMPWCAASVTLLN